MRKKRSFVDDAVSQPEVALLRSAVETPLLSSGLRSRVLSAAAHTRRRRARARRVLWGAALAVGCLALSAWCDPLWLVSSGLSNWGAASAVAADAARQPPPAA